MAVTEAVLRPQRRSQACRSNRYDREDSGEEDVENDRSHKSKSSRVGNNYGSSSNIHASASGHNMNGIVGCDQL